MKYPIAKPYIGKEEKAVVAKVLRSGVLSIGPEVVAFEKAFALKLGTKFACAVSSGTAGLHLTMLAAGLKKGDEVLTSPFSFIASANAILYVGATPVFVDINPVSFNIDPDKIEEKITTKTKAILVVHIFGQSADMKPILKLANKYKLKVIEDACESLNASYHGKKVGTFGESAVFAFYPNKQMTTGEGGMIVTNDRSVDALCRSLRNQGRSGNMQWLDHERLGYNYRLDEMSAALGRVQLQKLDWLIAEKRRIAALYKKHLAPYQKFLLLPRIISGNIHSWFVYVINIKNPLIKRDAVIEDLEKLGISTKAYLPSIHLFSFYKKLFKYKRGDFPVSEAVSDCSLALPFYIGLKEKDIKIISNIVVATLEKHEKYLQK
ncbi:MAG: hypothetical protein A3I32_00650 [Candidatus Yanofskybacteria bacterium RIFCSPLOWO2_02_FULL_45_10]|uniref:Polysaccharide biosynthesis protein n=3 Tax=Patescibacteria group TaxID=1783273 RepID=A0A1F8G2R2_9BACT|nr:MAG: Aminotransferase [Candidatus Daviesbacteria bacterium GW2011_GWB1_41_5]OGN19561.1 MAG: hypothetical protein A3F25_00465 [Candidatus Yanofskybacteria bacterium RIFCSPHIGHO2_12_FULL_45_19b]OGN32484.1 MAG: hypothetical protein A3I32_00650 [Candidatus Yanofskybacteria bacterium RIFCSPLOWO2_02_FULL_45_10]